MAIKKGHTPWEYQKGSTFLHRLPGGCKLFGLLVFSTGAFFSGLLALACFALLVFVLAACAGIKPRELLRGSLPLIIFVLFVFALSALEFAFDDAEALGFKISIKGGSLGEALLFSFRIAILFSAGALFFRVCTMGEIKRSLNRIETFLHINKLNMGLRLSLMMGFLPKFFVIWEGLNSAWDSRAGRRGLLRIVKLLPLTIERLMEKAAASAAALESRGA
ncbi:MAG: energy-coupling factor transporter transmembrane protein EcfT [Treponema sp.]|jgi:biotin transport system permease protein|nr:energy-coupling factor transporter transmembrane protein EcfT [Treponema sp.]